MAYELHEMDCRLAMSMLMDADSVDSIVCDPPYGLSKEPDMAEVLRHWLAGDDYTHGGSGFMGKTWDSFVPGPSVWREAYRVLKPGGYLIAFFGTRTYDLGTLAIRLAGFEIRDQLAWVFGSGFPKSLDVSKAIDKMDAVEVRRDRALRFTAWVRSVGLSSALIDEMTSTNMGGHYTTASSQPAVATRAHFEKLRPMFGDAPDWVEEMVDERTVESENYAAREVTGERTTGRGTGQGSTRVISDSGNYDLTSPHTDAAKQWQGWGTALKPAYEPIVLARKPLSERTVAANVLTHGTGGLNVDGCRVGTEGGGTHCSNRDADGKCLGHANAGRSTSGETFHGPEGVGGGRWPANLCHDGSDEVLAGFPVTTSGKMRAGTIRAARDGVCYGDDTGDTTDTDTIGDSGSAARFYYCAKASKADRNEGLDGYELITLQFDAWEKPDQKVTLLVDMAMSPPKVIGASDGAIVNAWNMMLSGNWSTAQSQPDTISTTVTTTNSTTVSTILSCFLKFVTSGNMAEVNCLAAYGTSLVESVALSIPKALITNEKTESLLGVDHVAFKTRLKISSEDGRNFHNTVKPTDLMRWLCRLVTPPGGTVFDPFAGSGSTGKAALLEGFQFVGCEMTPEYAAIARARLDAASVRGG